MFTDVVPENISIDDVTDFFQNDVQVSVLRLDKIHALISGNKWFKLRYYIIEALAQNKKTIITFGGAWSNHIIATAAACKLYGLNAIGIIRGEEPATPSATLLQAKAMGMQLVFIKREDYRHQSIPDNITISDAYMIHEGGYGVTGAKGAATIYDYMDESFTHICCAVGTGTMMAGLINASAAHQQVVGISVMKNNFSLQQAIQSLTGKEKNNWHLLHDHHFGGYAKHTPELTGFMNSFYRSTGIPTDFVYTAKLFYAVKALAGKNYFSAGSRLLLIHSGGLQGNSSLAKGTLMF